MKVKIILCDSYEESKFYYQAFIEHVMHFEGFHSLLQSDEYTLEVIKEEFLTKK